MIARNGALADLIAAGPASWSRPAGRASAWARRRRSGAVVAAHLQPQLPGPQRHRRRPGLPVQPARSAAATALTGVDHRPARPRRGAAREAAARSSTSTTRMIIPPPAKPDDGRDRPRPEHQAAARWPSRCRRRIAGDGAAQGGRQHHHRPHHAGGREGPAAALEHPGDRGVRLRARRPRASPQRAKEAGSGFVVGGEQLRPGLQPRARRPGADVPGRCKAVLAKSFARIHRANLVNFGILPLVFVDEADYDRIDQGDELEIAGVREAIRQRRQRPRPQSDARQRVHGPTRPLAAPGGDRAGGRPPELCEVVAGLTTSIRPQILEGGTSCAVR